jgi:hypothetical protein
LTDDQLTAVLRAAAPLAIGDRDAFLRDVAAALQGRELGDGAVYRAITQAQRRYYDPPILSAGSSRGRWFSEIGIPTLETPMIKTSSAAALVAAATSLNSSGRRWNALTLKSFHHFLHE